jgi:hypothetical protein
VGSGFEPVSNLSGKAVMKMTGTEYVRKISLTASTPELPSARWMSASTSPGRVCMTASIACRYVRATKTLHQGTAGRWR